MKRPKIILFPVGGAGLERRRRPRPAAGLASADALAGLHGYNASLAVIALAQVQRQPVAPLCGLLLALLLQPGFAAIGIPTLATPFFLACWLVEASAQRWRHAAKDGAPRASP